MDGRQARLTVTRGDVRLDVLAQGSGRPIIMLPSLGRGATDFTGIAARVAASGYRVLCPQPRGIGASTSPRPYADLQDCAADVAAVIETLADGPAFVTGHAFGNRVSRMLATARPDLVEAVSLIAANVGKDPSPPDIRAAIRDSADPTLSPERRREALRFAFFAPGNDPSPWLDGWHPDVLAAQRWAGDQTSRMIDYAGGGKPILYLQPSHDPLAHVEDAETFRRELGSRVTVVIIPNASHAAIAEQPGFIASELVKYAAGLWHGGDA